MNDPLNQVCISLIGWGVISVSFAHRLLIRDAWILIESIFQFVICAKRMTLGLLSRKNEYLVSRDDKACIDLCKAR